MDFQTLQVPKKAELSINLPYYSRDCTAYGEGFFVRSSADEVVDRGLISGPLPSINHIANGLVN